MIYNIRNTLEALNCQERTNIKYLQNCAKILKKCYFPFLFQCFNDFVFVVVYINEVYLREK